MFRHKYTLVRVNNAHLKHGLTNIAVVGGS